MKIRTLKELITVLGISQQDIANRMSLSKTTISMLVNNNYSGDAPNMIKAIFQAYIDDGKIKAEDVDVMEITTSFNGALPIIEIKKDAFLSTGNVIRFNSLADDLLDPDSTLNASIGLCIGRAGYGKTTAVRRYIANNADTIYILWMNYTRPQLFARIAEELCGRSYNSYLKNIKTIIDVTRVYRKLIVIDEADRMPLNILEDLRTLNEEGLVPLLLVGEDTLTSKVKKADRIESRIRKPIVKFTPLDHIELSAFYQKATGLILEEQVAKKLARDAHNDFRIAANDMQEIVGLMNKNGQGELTMEVLNAIRCAR